MLYLYRVAFYDVDFGYAAAVGLALMLLMFTLTLIQRLTFGGRRRPDGDGETPPTGSFRPRHRSSRCHRRRSRADGRSRSGTPGSIPADRSGTRTIVVYSLLFAIALLFFVPFLWMVSTSFKTLPETAYFSLLPKHWTFDAYREALTSSISGATRSTAPAWPSR